MLELRSSLAQQYDAWSIAFDGDEDNSSEIIQQIWAQLEFFGEEPMSEIEQLKRKLEQMIDGIIPVNRLAIERYNRLCIMRRDSEGH